MRIKKIDAKIERDIIIGFIVSTSFIKQLKNSFELSYLRNSYSKTIASWCLEYYKKYEEAPFRQIQQIYEYENRKGNIEEDEIDLIEKLLDNINQQYEEGDNFNVNFYVDEAEKYFNKIILEKLANNILAEVENDNINKAQQLHTEFKNLTLTSSNAIDPLNNQEKLQAAFENHSKPLFLLPGTFGEILNEHLVRASFVAFQGPEKSGKTFLLNHLVLEALRNRLRVAYFQLGDLTEEQTIVRLSISLAKKSNKKKYCNSFVRPIKFIEGGKRNKNLENILPDEYGIKHIQENIEEELCWREAWKINQNFYKKYRIRKNKYFKLITAPGDTMNIVKIDSKLDRLHLEENFTPDVVVFDYMDLLCAEDSREVGRDKINGNWMAAKALCNKRKFLLISATQADAESYDGSLQTKKNFSNDKRKYSHTNATIGMNQTDEEKKCGVNKLNVLVAREGEFLTNRPCLILQSLRQGLPVIDSIWGVNKSDYIEKNDDKKTQRNLRRKKIKKR